MGLITQILTLPLAPVRGSVWVLDQVVLAAEREYYDPDPVRKELADLEKELLSGGISEEEFDRREDELLDRLDEIEAHQRRLRANP
ncbi:MULTISPECIES: gas vesicle protein GvpG [Streptomyces]|uniref:Gas vesicle protein n=1 Tax=Streptomyces niveus TaxID=193462 RepID=A0A1U9QNS4_STRNV|nr:MULTISPECIES: gas vesicle protein GvpG [Streptomyces]AQU65305.1 gas vesicle protein [Streptomyces niveus]MCI3222691.1 gas vesicle protein [Streptomyces sp. NP-1717]WTA77454.1 gas vesicle protein GvpG [Streptomyces sp. NBC_00838]